MFAAFALVLPAAVLLGARWLAVTLAPGFASAIGVACTAMAPYLLWVVVYAALVWAATQIFVESDW